ncbi:effector binding domain-containing protein [Gorillibacterium timonense]|uniref:effector binding domain-containing protein n=1 Tax=Gorillibacterium timonense TaxID=1689269 RepID=UPI00071E0ED8|nr:effector binding domain-containing protein [Gorillibacterium timonense]
MELQTISTVSQHYGISTRMLRYYEQIGLIESFRKEDYAYRMYDENVLKRLQQIILLRKLRVPVKQIGTVLNNPNATTAIEVFQQNMEELDQEIAALSTIRAILNRFVQELQTKTNQPFRLEALDDATVLELTSSLSFSKNHLKEDKTMEDLNKATEKVTKLTDVRIIYLPPMTMASSHYVGEDCERHAGQALDQFVQETGLLTIKPDIRHFGFNNPVHQGDPGEASAGYEMWISIPEAMEVPAPLKKIQFHGGLYAAHAITFGNFDHWGLLYEWVMNHDQYTSDWGSLRCTPHVEGMDWALEEQLNFLTNSQNPHFDSNTMQLDLLFPVREK